MIWTIAWKNIWRNKVRSLVIIMAISLGLLGGIFSSAVMKGMGDQRVREAIGRETSHIQIHNPAYLEDNEITFTINRYDLSQLSKILDSLPEVYGWSARIKFQCMANSASASTGVMVFGVDPAKERTVSDIPSMICDSCGNYLAGEKHNFAVVGFALARKLKIRLHSKVILTFQDMHGNLTGSAFRVCGIYHTSNSVFDEMNIFVDQTDIASSLAIPPGEFHEIAIRLNNLTQVQFVQEKLHRLFTGLSVRNWKQIDPTLGLLNDLMNTWLYLFMSIILLALTFGIINSMQMVILERIRELGMLAAIGMNRPRVFLMIMLESVFLSLAGGVTGMALGLGLLSITRHTGINLSRLATGFEKIGFNPVLYPSLDIQFFIVLILMVILIGILASVYPAMKALRQNPAEAIRHE
jgi:putative ABC transport system permease protein